MGSCAPRMVTPELADSWSQPAPAAGLLSAAHVERSCQHACCRAPAEAAAMAPGAWHLPAGALAGTVVQVSRLHSACLGEKGMAALQGKVIVLKHWRLAPCSILQCMSS